MSEVIKTTLTADNTSFKAAFESAAGAVDGWKKRVGGALGDITSKMGAFGAAAGAIGAAVVIHGISSLAEEVDRVGKLATRFELPVEDVQKFSVAAQVSGTDLEVLAKGLQKATVNGINAGRGMLVAKESFADLNVNVDEFNKASPQEKLKMLATGFQKTADHGKAMAAVIGILGKSGGELIPLLKEGGDGLGIEKFNDQLTVMKANLQTALAKQLAGQVGALKDVMEGLSKTIASAAEFLIDYHTAILDVAKAWIAWKGLKIGYEIAAATISMAKLIFKTTESVIATWGSKAAIDAQTKSLVLNTAAKKINAGAGGGGVESAAGSGVGEAASATWKNGFKNTFDFIKEKGAALGRVLLSGFTSFLAAAATAVMVTVGVVAAVIGVGIAVWVKWQERVTDATLKTHEALNEANKSSWEAVNAAKTVSETEAARADIADEILALKKQAAAEGNAERKTAIETTIETLKLLSVRADEFRLRNQSAEAAQKAAAQAVVERENAEFAAGLDEQRLANAKLLIQAAKDRAAAIADGNAKIRQEIGAKLFDREGAKQQLADLKADLSGSMKDLNFFQGFSERSAGRPATPLTSLDDIKGAADAAHGRGDVDQEKVLLGYLKNIFDVKNKIFDLEKAAAAKRAEETKAAGDFTLEGKILAARVMGNTVLEKSLQRQQAIEAMKLSLMQSQGLTAKAALAMATKRADLETTASEAAEKAAKAKSQTDAKRDFAGEMAILKLRSHGQDGQADALAKEIENRKDAVRLADQMGISEADALKLVRERSDLEKQIDDRKNGAAARHHSKIYTLTPEDSAARGVPRFGSGGLRTGSLHTGVLDRQSQQGSMANKANKDRADAASYYERSLTAQEQLVKIFNKLGVA
jgi:hypothetical protein